MPEKSKYTVGVVTETKPCVECHEKIVVRDGYVWTVLRDDLPLCRVCAEALAPETLKEADLFSEAKRQSEAKAVTRNMTATASKAPTAGAPSAPTQEPDESNFRVMLTPQGHVSQCAACGTKLRFLTDVASVVEVSADPSEFEAELCTNCARKRAPRLAATARRMNRSRNALAVLAGQTP